VLIPYLVSRQVFCGAGKVAPLEGTGNFDFQISQRADVFETLISLQTTINRPIINTRDEPHADNQRYGRLHVITGDSNLAEYSTYLKVGTAALVLEMLVHDKLRLDLTLADPLRDMRMVSYDPSCRRKVELETDRRRLSAVDIQRYLVEAAFHYLDEIEDNGYRRHICRLWSETLDLLADNPAHLSSRLDWVIKYEFLKLQIDKGSLSWESPQIRELDIRYHQLDLNHSLFRMLKKNGFVETLVTEEQVSEAAVRPPTDTRASIRIACLEKFAEQIVSVNWDTIVFEARSGQLFRWRIDDPAPADCSEIRKKIIKADSMEAFVHSILSSQIKDNHYGTQNGI
jgi:proteasome accessory factor A